MSVRRGHVESTGASDACRLREDQETDVWWTSKRSAERTSIAGESAASREGDCWTCHRTGRGFQQDSVYLSRVTRWL
jgi:hypothetical protein